MHEGAERIQLDVKDMLIAEELPKVLLGIVSIVVHQKRLGMK